MAETDGKFYHKGFTIVGCTDQDDRSRYEGGLFYWERVNLRSGYRAWVFRFMYRGVACMI